MAKATVRPPAWYWLAAVALLLWGAMGVVAWYRQATIGAASWGDVTDYDLRYYARLPGWYNWVYLLSTAAGLAGAIALLVRSIAARLLFQISLLGIVVMFGWAFLATDLIAHKGTATVVPFPVFIALVPGLAIWLASVARGRGWIG